MIRQASRHAVALAATVVLSAALPAAAQDQPQNQPGQRNAPGQAQPAAAQSPAQGKAQPQGQPQAQSPNQQQGQPQGATDPNKVVLSVGNEKVTAGEVDALVNDLPAAQRQVLQRAGRRMLAEELVRIKLFAQEAKARKLDQDPKVQRQLELTQDQILATALAGDMLRKNYEANKQQFEKIQARHILIRTPGSRAPVRPGQKELSEAEAKAKADDLRKRIVGGEDFGELARKESDDTVSGAQGGSMDPFGRGAMVPEFDKAAFALKEGEVSEPVKTQFGYHIIQVQDILSFEDVQNEVAGQSNAQIQQMMEELRKKTPVQVDESYFGPPLAAPGIPPGTGQQAPGQPGAQGQPGAPGQPPAPSQAK